jgi:hypothetical protein
MEPGSLPVVRIADDGELVDVRNLLEQLGIEWLAGDEAAERPTALLIANPRRLIAARSNGGAAAPLPAFRIVVADKMTRSLQRELERSRPDFLVSRPFHPAALRLLILHALYAGPERRGSARVAISAPIRFRTSVFSRGATLVELSRGGCRLIAGHVPAVGEPITVILPKELTGTASLSLAGRIVASDPAGGFEPGEQACSVAFEPLDPEKRRGLRVLMTSHAVASATLDPREAQRPAAAAPASTSASAAIAPAANSKSNAKPSAKSAATAPSERRRSSRKPYPRPVLASGGGAARVLIGRDLSSGGMRVAPDSDLIVGDEIKLVIYGPAGRPPLLMRASVARDDGDDGCVLIFQDVAPESAVELAQWTAVLPDLGANAESAPPTHSIVSEVVEEPETPAS